MEPDESAAVPSVTEVDESVLRDLESKYIDVRCPVHDEAPKFEVGPDGAVVERFCCETLLSVFRELQASEQDVADDQPPQEAITSDNSELPR